MGRLFTPFHKNAISNVYTTYSVAHSGNTLDFSTKLWKSFVLGKIGQNTRKKTCMWVAVGSIVELVEESG